ncbi:MULTISPECIES: hypothetical protein [Flavobacteriaceae]|uniref:Uncharacterized protein n=1 Tax=Flagellimonas marina TaxID=1775168 RepID=A0ABV8PSN3_9FLAO
MSQEKDVNIRLHYNTTWKSSDFERINEQLPKNYNFEFEERQYVHTGIHGFEVWIEIVVTSPIFQFIAGAISSGLFWDFFKKFSKNTFLKPFFSSLQKLNKTPLGYKKMEIVAIKIKFDDVTIKIYGLRKNFTSILSSIFQQLQAHILKIKSLGLNSISEIRIPLLWTGKRNENGKFYEITYHYNRNKKNSFKDYFQEWEVVCADTNKSYIYNLKKKNIRFINTFTNNV